MVRARRGALPWFVYILSGVLFGTLTAFVRIAAVGPEGQWLSLYALAYVVGSPMGAFAVFLIERRWFPEGALAPARLGLMILFMGGVGPGTVALVVWAARSLL